MNAWLVEAGLLDIAHGDPIGLVVATRCAYFAPLAFPEMPRSGSRWIGWATSSVTYRIGIFAEGADNAAAQGEFTHVYVDRETRNRRHCRRAGGRN